METATLNQRRKVILFHAPNTRSAGVLTLLEELGAEYELQVLNLKAGDSRKPAYLAINPMGKVPAILHDGALVTEQVAIYQYLADLYADRSLAPQMGDPLRGPYLRWLAFYGSSFEPAIVDRALKRDPAPQGMAPYGDYDTMFRTLDDQLTHGPWILGADFCAADVLWGAALAWATRFGIVSATPVIQAYIERANARPATLRVRAKDAQLAAAQG
jgi:glutathione S-transferase